PAPGAGPPLELPDFDGCLCGAGGAGGAAVWRGAAIFPAGTDRAGPLAAMRPVRLGLACLALCALAACGQDSPLTPDTNAQSWPESMSGMALLAPTLAPGETPAHLAHLLAAPPPRPDRAPEEARPDPVVAQ